MAKLYWRVKRDGKWTWRPAQVVHYCSENYTYEVEIEFDEEEEEFVQTGNGTVARRLQELEEEE